CNTGLLNLIMVSRLSYGMAREGLLPRALARIDTRRKTPWVAVLGAGGLALLLGLSGGVEVLAQTTSLLLQAVSLTLHIGLLLVKRRGPPRAEGFATPAWTPVLGALLCGGMLFRYPLEVYLRGLIV